MAKIVVALGGNALSIDGKATAASQQAVAYQTALELTKLITAGHQLVVVHGNGPQIGNIILHEEAINTEKTPTMPIDTCGAMSQGQIGYWLQQAFSTIFKAQKIRKPVATIVTQVLVDPKDPAFKNPTKPIGPFYSQSDAKRIAKERGFTFKEDSGRGWRRVVPSPKPIGVVEADFLRLAVYNQALVITAGGGGIPVYYQSGRYIGLEAVIDKDFAAAKVAELIDADILLILTAIDAVKINYRTENESSLSSIKASEIKTHIATGQFAEGSMLPKIEASLAFLKNKHQKAIIASPEAALSSLKGRSGTTITL